MSVEAGNAPYRVALPDFEGPLDLLLHLCKTHEIEIVKIPIAFITEKYLEYLEVMQTMPVDVAADYLVMAATLAYLKSRELVPSPEPLEVVADEEGEVADPREELIRRLLQYQKYKDAAEKLGSRPIEGRNVFGRGAELETGDTQSPLAEHSIWKLIESFGKLLEKSGGTLAHDVIVDRMSISECINQLIDRIEAGGGSFRFDACFDPGSSEGDLRNQVVVTLLAILELARLKVIRVLATADSETLFIAQVPGAALADARRAEVTSALEDGDQEDEGGEAVAEWANTEAVTAVGESEPVHVVADRPEAADRPSAPDGHTVAVKTEDEISSSSGETNEEA